MAGGVVKAVLDVDSEALATFDEVDRHYLELLCTHLSEALYA
jgi:putative methionine-R-sulfoxide reductase with GAF domain